MARTLEGASFGAARPARAAQELPLAAAIVGILLVILVPLPTGAVDFLLVGNIAVSLMVLMTAACISRPLEFNVFPSLLLVITFYRLALNVATTRLILSNAGDAGLAAAGGVVRAFAEFVAGQNVVVGLVIFAILVVVQFVVITRGATRISEVAARFTLDAMPGKQLAIDGELSGGLIGEDEARRRRAELEREADFYGAMDGASKFVRGEAVAALLITTVNLVGGFAIGVLERGMRLEEAAATFSRLTVGDGLVSQIPALMVSVGSALLVTRSSGGEGFALDLRRQLVRDERLFFAAGAFLVALVPAGLPPVPLAAASFGCFAVGFLLRRKEEGPRAVEEPETAAAEPAPAPAGDDRIRSLLAVEPIEVEIGYRLLVLVEEARGGDLVRRLAEIRERLALDLGLVLPPIRVRDNTRLHPREYAVHIRGTCVGRWRIHPDRVMVLPDAETADLPGAAEGTDPVTGKRCLWVEAEVVALGPGGSLPFRGARDVLAEHLERLLRLHAADLLTREEVSRLLADLRRKSPALVDELVPGVLKIGEIHKVLQNLLRERVSIRNLEQILEALADRAERTRDAGELTEAARSVLAPSISARLADRNRTLRASLLDPALEEFLQNSLEKTDSGTRLAVEPEMEEALAESMSKALSDMEAKGLPPVLVCSGLVRKHLRDIASRAVPMATVLSYGEVSGGQRLEAFASVSLDSGSLRPKGEIHEL